MRGPYMLRQPEEAAMSKMDWNKFVQTHKKGFALVLTCSDYRPGGAVKWSGEKVPTLYQVASAAAKKAIKCDYSVTVIPKTKSKAVSIVLSDKTEFDALAKAWQASTSNLSLGPAVAVVVVSALSDKHFFKAAIAYNLISPPPTSA
jgi:hypothetical protein